MHFIVLAAETLPICVVTEFLDHVRYPPHLTLRFGGICGRSDSPTYNPVTYCRPPRRMKTVLYVFTDQLASSRILIMFAK